MLVTFMGLVLEVIVLSVYRSSRESTRHRQRERERKRDSKKDVTIGSRGISFTLSLLFEE